MDRHDTVHGIWDIVGRETKGVVHTVVSDKCPGNGATPSDCKTLSNPTPNLFVSSVTLIVTCEIGLTIRKAAISTGVEQDLVEVGCGLRRRDGRQIDQIRHKNLHGRISLASRRL